ncbi:MAG: flagellar M-ring protein FliF [Holophagales bacterium]|jgi:flagellar M-ring protein FliF|nr:flagellar M-ring protein FliF [Holophagales bacterium]
MANASAEIKSVISQIKKVFQGLTTLQKSMLAAITVIVILFLAALAFLTGREHMDILITDLNSIDAAAVVESLKKQGVKYELSSDQRTIYVPEKQVSQLKLKIAGESILTGENVGFEKLESPGLTTTDFTQKVIYKTGLENRLAKTLREGLAYLIKDAKVQITPANESLFIIDKEDAKASVLLQLRNNRPLPEENTLAIVNLVANSVEGLKPENVIVSDQYARILNRRDSQAKVTDAQRKTRLDEEEHLTWKVMEQLEPVAGKGKVRVTAAVELDFDKVQIKEDKYDPQGQVERAVETIEEKSTKRDERLGIPGTPTNVAPANAGAEGGNIIESKDYRHSVTNFEITQTSRAIEKSPGSLKRVSVSALLDYKTIYERNPKGAWEPKSVAWTDEELDKFRNQIIGAAGIDKARGDTVSVDTISFASTTNPMEEAAAQRQFWMELAKLLAPFAVIIFALIAWLIYKFVTREKKVPPEPELVPIFEEEEEEEEAEDMPEKIKSKTLAEVKAEIENEINAESASQAPEAQRREVIKQRINEIVLGDPENAASLIRSWLVDDEDGKKR